MVNIRKNPSSFLRKGFALYLKFVPHPSYRLYAVAAATEPASEQLYLPVKTVRSTPKLSYPHTSLIILSRESTAPLLFTNSISRAYSLAVRLFLVSSTVTVSPKESISIPPILTIPFRYPGPKYWSYVCS